MEVTHRPTFPLQSNLQCSPPRSHPALPALVTALQGSFWEQNPGLRHPEHSPGIPNTKVPFPAACESSTAGFHLPLLFSSCYSVITSPLKSPLALQGLPSLIPLEEFCFKPLSGYGNFCQNAFSSTLMRGFPFFCFSPSAFPPQLRCCIGQHPPGSTSPLKFQPGISSRRQERLAVPFGEPCHTLVFHCCRRQMFFIPYQRAQICSCSHCLY